MIAFSERLKALRKAAGFNQTELGEKLNCQRTRIADLERGKSTPSLEDIEILCREFDVSSDYLLGLSDVRTNEPDVKMICDYTGLSEEAVRNLHDYVSSAADTANTELYSVMIRVIEYLLSEKTMTENPYATTLLLEIAYYERDLQIQYQFIKDNREFLKKPHPAHENRAETTAETIRAYNMIRVDRADLKDRFEKFLRLLSDHTEDEMENMIRQIRNMSLHEGDSSCPQ